MNQDLEHLVVLQAQDLDLGRLRTEIGSLPARIGAAQAALAPVQAQAAAAQASLAGEEKLRREQEREIATQRTKLERLRRSLDSATSSAQVAAFEHEIGFATAAISRLEDEELASMERTEALEATLVGANEEASRRERMLADERSRAARVQAENEEGIRGLETQRSTLRAEIGEDSLGQYDRLRKAKGTAVAEALGSATQGKCSACQMAVRPQRWQDLIGRDHQDRIFTCESCGRMLFWDPRRDTPKPWEAGERLQKAQAAREAMGR